VLRELRIENLLLIDRAELRLGEGLNAITGETGAGKTILAHSLDLLMGGRARAQIVRPGAEEAWVEGVFDLPADLLAEPELRELAERLPEGEGEIALGRRVAATGRTTAFVAGRAASAADLKLLGGRLLAFYGQHEHRKLTISSVQAEVLDGFAGAKHLDLRERYLEAHRDCLRLEDELAELRERDGSRERDLDLYRFELSEIEEVAPDPAETAALSTERERLRHGEELREAAIGAHSSSAGVEDDGGGAIAALGQAEALLGGVAGVDSELDAISGRLSAAAVEAVCPKMATDGFAFDVEMLALARQHRLAVREIGITWHGDQESRVALAGGIAAFVDVLRIAWRFRKQPAHAADDDPEPPKERLGPFSARVWAYIIAAVSAAATVSTDRSLMQR